MHSLGSLGAIDWLMPTSHTGGNSQPKLPHVPYHPKTPHPQKNNPKSKRYNYVSKIPETQNMEQSVMEQSVMEQSIMKLEKCLTSHLDY